jgi:HEPN domain-containing protein
MEECERLNTAYIDTRYPVHWPTDYSKDKAIGLKNDAEKIGRAIKKSLGKGGFV